MHRNFVKTSVLAVTGAAVFVAGSMGGAVAARVIGSEDILNNSIRQQDLGPGSVGTGELKAGSVGWGEINTAAQDRVQSLAGQDGLDGVDGTNGIDGANGIDGKDGAIGPDGPQGPAGPAGPQGPKGDPASDEFGKFGTGYVTTGLVPINKIGGSYTANATDLGTFTVNKSGRYMINAYGFFDRLNDNEAGYEAPPTDTYLQLTVRGGTGHAGTCFTPAVSPRGFTETTCQSVLWVDATAGDVFTVRAFGYNEDRSGFGGAPNSATPQFKVAANVSAIRIGNDQN